MGKTPWRIAFWKPEKSLAVINDVYEKTKEYSLQYKDIVELVEIIPSKSKTDDYDKSICCGIAGGDDALNAVSSSYRESGIPILSLTGFKLSESSSTYPMLPSPRLSGLLFARAMLRSLRKVRDKKRIRVLLLTQSGDDASGLRYKEFSDVLKFNTSMGVEVDGIEFDGKCINLEKKTFCAKTGEKTYSFDDVSKYDYVAVFGFGDKYNDWVLQLITACKRKQTATQFWCDYNYSSREVPNNLHRIGLKNCYGNKVFEAITCAAVDILVSGLSSNSQFAHDAGSFNSWLMDLTCFKSTYIDNILFTHGNHLPSFPFYCSSVGHPDTLLDAFEEAADYPAEESVKYLQETDGKVSAWLRNDKESDRELLDAITQNVLAKYYPILSVAVAYGDAKLASEGIETESVKLSKLLFGVVHDQPKDFVLQVNIDAEDIPNNDTQRLFVKNPRRDIKDPIPLLHYLRKTKDYCDDDSQATLLLGCQLEEAKTISMVDAKNILAILRTILDKARTSCIRYLYLIDYDSDYFSEKEKERKWIACVLANEKLDVYDCRICSYIIKSVLSAYLKRDRDRSIILANTKSAIGSIMSRNGSHNIGSHVLAALSHNVGTLPDDRVLYQYIQQRMDYIATVTTDFPTWTQPTMFVADMIKTFLSQRHLLDHIVESEGLHAFQFQNPNMTDEEWAAQKNCVKIHVRRKIGEEYKEFIDYTKRDAKVSLQDGTEECDISLAIPGGIIGEHAFYTILENIIRNAAKHSWATGNNNAKNLDIYIDFTDEDEQVKFKVYAKLEPSKCKKLVDELKKKLSQSFIDEDTGALRRENWGLAEMKISAGYLAGESIEAIGGVGDKKGTNDIISPCIKSEKVKRKCVRSEKEVEDEEQYLGYEFSIAKPKEILIIVAEELKTNGENDKWGNSTVRKELNKVGVFVKTVDEIKQENRLNYRYVIHYNASELFDKGYHVKDGILLPFRVLSGVKIKNRLNKFIPAISFGDLKKCFESKGKTTIARKTDIERLVYKVYSAHLFRQQNIKKLGLLVAINENEKSGGNSLISDADILELMMEQNFAVCIDQYDALAQNENSRGTIKLLHLIKNSSNKKVVKFKDVQGRTIRELIAQRLYNWIYNNSDINDGEICQHLKQKYYAIEKNESESAKRGNGNSNNDDFERGVNALLSRHPIDDFIRYAESVFENTKKLFKQYEEQIVTLPAGYKINTASEAKQKNKGSNNEVALDGVEIVTNIEGVKDKDRHWIGYRRHDHTLPVDDSKSLYVEPLSGTQTYLSQLTKVKDNLGLQMRLIENGLMRILVLDERVAKFLREHQKEVGPHYKAMNINVIDDKLVEGNVLDKEGFFTGYTRELTKDLKEFAKKAIENKGVKDIYIGGQKKKEKKDKIKMEDEIKEKFANIDILIVHQGILDKWFFDLKSVEGMKYLLEGFKRLVKYVVITTGRGTPENIPDEAHLLPFAVVESTLFKKYPEKLILTDTIMNVLPVGMKNGNTGDKK